jgi:hypothetical protein
VKLEGMPDAHSEAGMIQILTRSTKMESFHFRQSRNKGQAISSQYVFADVKTEHVKVSFSS